MTCQDCGSKMTIEKTAHFSKATMRVEQCACGSRFETEEKVIRRLPAAVRRQPAPADSTPAGGQSPPATASTPPATAGGEGGALPSGLSGSGPGSISGTSLPPDLQSDRPPARVGEQPPIPDHEIPRPFRPRPRLPRVGAATLAYLRIYDAYPKKLGKQEAAQIFQELAEDYPGGETALSATIMAAFAAGMLKRHPYSGDDEHRPSLEKFLAGRRWEDDQSAPDDVNHGQSASSRKPRELPFA